MDKTTAGLIGALSGLAAAASAQAAPSVAPAMRNVMEITSYADLLRPIPNALAVLQQTADAQPVQAEGQAAIETVQFHHHHHHHHHRYYRRRHHHHHHRYF